MLRNKSIAAVVLLLCSGSVSAACVGYQNPPAGKPNDFDINKHLKTFDAAGKAIAKLPSGGPFGQTAVRAALMTSMFYSGRKYDLKNNPNMRSSQEFGNWFFGAAASEMGYTKIEALKAGAIVQQWQNYGYKNHPAKGDLGILATEMYQAILHGNNDNPDDAPQIEGGFDYSKEINEKDPNSSSKSNSCESSQSASGNSGGGYGYGGGWGGGLYLGVGGCYGNCGGATGSVKIIDIAPISVR